MNQPVMTAKPKPVATLTMRIKRTDGTVETRVVPATVHLLEEPDDADRIH